MAVLRVSFFTPRVMPNLVSPAVILDVRDDSCCGYQGVVQLMSHFNRAKKKLKLINRLFLSGSSERKGEGGSIPQIR